MGCRDVACKDVACNVSTIQYKYTVMQQLKKLFTQPNTLLVLFLFLAILASVQSVLLGLKTFQPDGPLYTHYNNYVIFKQSFFHLLQQQDLFILYPAEHWDLYKYSPTFALFFALFAYLPDWLGLILWNVLNALVLFFGVKALPHFNDKQKALMLLIVVLELMTSLQNAQSNAMMAGLMIWAFAALERRQYLAATFFIMATVYIKIFGLVAMALFLFYPRKDKLALYSAAWAVLLFVLPLPVVNWEQLLFLYRSWGHLLQDDHSASYGFSVMGWLHSWFGLEAGKLAVLGTGVVLFCLPLLRFHLYSNLIFRTLCLCSVLIWVIIFNHKAESATFVIAMSGIAIWFFVQETWSWENAVLLVLAIVFTSLSPTDLFPRFIRKGILEPYVVKAVPCILIWAKIVWEMLRLPRTTVVPQA